ncbi:hypothetical protein SLE2022_354280 [Rubroshorea leprosula]
MASRVSALKFVFVLLFSFSVVQIAVAGDPDILTDFVSPPNSNVDRSFFTFTGMPAVLGSASVQVSMSQKPAQRNSQL